MGLISDQILQLWYKFVELPKITPKFISALLGFQYNDRIKERWETCSIRNVVKTHDFAKFHVARVKNKRDAVAKRRRRQIAKRPFIKGLNVMDTRIFEKFSTQPVLFEDWYCRVSEDYIGENVDDDDGVIAVKENTLEYE